jgi:hypothetical protein
MASLEKALRKAAGGTTQIEDGGCGRQVRGKDFYLAAVRKSSIDLNRAAILCDDPRTLTSGALYLRHDSTIHRAG